MGYHNLDRRCRRAGNRERAGTREGCPGLAFETWGPPSRSPLPSDNCRANLTGSPIIEDNDAPDRMTVFMVPVATWSGGVSDSDDGH
jgi:hypothetical protein